MTAALQALAGLVGIAPAYHDIFGRHYETSDATRRAILAALGIAVGTEAEEAASLAQWQAALEGRVVPPTLVLPEEDPAPAVPLRGHGRLAWRLVEEDGASTEGAVDLSALPAAADGTRSWPLPAALPAGYHRLALTGEDGTVASSLLIRAPRRCWTPEDIAPGRRFWGLSCQLYALRQEGDWGIGTFTALGRLVAAVAARGGDAVGLNPLHAIFPADPGQCSPYSPSSRDFLNILNIDPQAAPEFAGSAPAQALVATPDWQQARAALEAAPAIDYPALARLLMPVLQALHDSFDREASPERRAAFAEFAKRRGPALRGFALFHALQGHFSVDNPSALAWWNWPAEYHASDSPAVAEFAVSHAREVGFHEYLQFLADEQLGAAAEAACAAGMAVGLYRDLAVGAGPASAAAWADQSALAAALSVGAPPDLLNQKGQNWGLAPLNPITLRERGYQPFIEALRANMRHAGALRLDHVMALKHLFCVPRGLSADQGAYLAYPFEDMLRILALESRRHRCIVIGEDLGTVPEGFRPAMEAAGVLSYRVFQFERMSGGHFNQPETYPVQALVTAGTHDLPTLAGLWSGEDLRWRQQLNLYRDETARTGDAAARETDRRQILEALAWARLWPYDHSDPTQVRMDAPLLEAVHRFLARAPSRLMMVQVEDVLGQVAQVNLPGTIDEHPNWRLRLSATVDALAADPAVIRLLGIIDAERRGAGQGGVA